MAISLTEIIAALEAKSNATDSSSSISDILRLTQASEQVSDGTILYDSAGVMPTDSAFIGALAATSNGTIYFYNGTAWNAVDSAETISIPPIPYSFQGSTSGYMSGGTTPDTNIIDKFPFSSDGNATDVGDLTEAKQRGAGQSSPDNGYASGGVNPTFPTVNTNVIEKFPFASDANATDVGDMLGTIRENSGTSSETNGYNAGGNDGTPAPNVINVIEKFPFSTDANGADVGDMTVARTGSSGQSSTTHGYASSGALPGASNIIDKYSFSTDGNATDVGDATFSATLTGGQSSSTHGYISGGDSTRPDIQKFPFASDANATDVGDLLAGIQYVTGQSSTASGYTTGGTPIPNGGNIIQKFPFSTDANATDVGDLTVSRYGGMGHQV